MTKCEYCPLELCAPLGKHDRCDCECHPPREDPATLLGYGSHYVEAVRAARDALAKERAVAIFERRMGFGYTDEYEQSREWSDAMAEATGSTEPAHDPRCISLTDSEFNNHCDCATLRMIDAHEPTDRASS